MNRQAKRYAPSGLALAGRLTAGKREIKDFPKFAFGKLLLSAIC